MTIFIFGNPDLTFDSLPLRILPGLKKRFPQVKFEVRDPNEEWDVPEELILIDTVFGIERARIFDDLKNFENSPRVSLHDFDLTHLRHLQKLGKFKKVKIIGVPPTISEKEVIKQIAAILRSCS
ncbi:MAG: hypothetical protein UX33_C0041G0010 [Candidatus Azambacteria bacterium GW2011_GWC1_46_13]|uniref:Uncharacterized protein n=2 Tax=Candidatus Azamiibacteriota TaxID=1752741 RepID=A0A0G1NK36_9BACT|nr:MAG: hypothetical protein UX33_C0041G0010 [Candidatus Azambacteria bacterium GW2011_GWC1_46_13]